MYGKLVDDGCEVSQEAVSRLLPRFFDPLEDIASPEYFELARSLLDLYRCMQLKAQRGERGIDDTLIIMENLIKISVNDAIEKYHNRKFHERIEKAMKALSESEVKVLNDYLKLGVQIIGLNMTPLAPFVSDKVFLQYIGSILKASALIAVGVKKYWAVRTIRKLSVHVETVSRKIIKDIVKSLDKYGKVIGMVYDVIGSATSSESLSRLSRELYDERVYANTPEVIAFARELQELRKQFIRELMK